MTRSYDSLGRGRSKRQQQITLMLKHCGRDKTDAQAALERLTDTQALYLQVQLRVRAERASGSGAAQRRAALRQHGRGRERVPLC